MDTRKASKSKVQASCAQAGWTQAAREVKDNCPMAMPVTGFSMDEEVGSEVQEHMHSLS